MRIAIDANRAVVESAGIGRYTFEVIDQLLKIDKKNEYFLVFTHWNTDPEKERRVKYLTRNGQIDSVHLRLPGKLKSILWGIGFPWYKKYLKGSDVLFAPSFFEANLGLKIPQITTMHDMSFVLFPDQRGRMSANFLANRARKVCNISKKIIADSFATKKDVEKIYNIKSDKIEVIWLGRKEFNLISDKLPNNLKKDSYILATGTVEPRKNLVGLFEAYSMLDEATQDKYPLVIAGAKGWNTGETFETLEKLRLTDKVIFLGFVADEVLAKIYQDCLFFIYPSFYEGFGLPILEALYFEKAVITSDVSSMPEVAGDAALLIDPKSPKSIFEGMRRLIVDEKKREALSKNARAQADKFEWKKTAEETLKVIEDAVK
jgi:glycosyltransferase involved in cell wall biosynthesis